MLSSITVRRYTDSLKRDRKLSFVVYINKSMCSWRKRKCGAELRAVDVKIYLSNYSYLQRLITATMQFKRQLIGSLKQKHVSSSSVAGKWPITANRRVSSILQLYKMQSADFSGRILFIGFLLFIIVLWQNWGTSGRDRWLEGGSPKCSGIWIVHIDLFSWTCSSRFVILDSFTLICNPDFFKYLLHCLLGNPNGSYTILPYVSHCLMCPTARCTPLHVVHHHSMYPITGCTPSLDVPHHSTCPTARYHPSSDLLQYPIRR